MKVCDRYEAHNKGDRFPAKKLQLPPPGALCAIAAYGGRFAAMPFGRLQRSIATLILLH